MWNGNSRMLFCDAVCFSYIPFPDEQRLQDILAAHFPHTATPLTTSAVALFLELRNAFRLTKKPATAELLDWVRALTTVFAPADAERCLTQATAQPQRGSAVIWRLLPALGCLLKLREDVERVTQET